MREYDELSKELEQLKVNFMWVVANINQYYTFRNSIDELFKDETKIYFPKLIMKKIIVKI